MDKEKIGEAKERFKNKSKIDLVTLIRKFKREGIENFAVTKREDIDTLLQYIDKLENMYEKEHTEHLYHKENSDKFFNQFNRLQINMKENYISKQKIKELINKLEQTDGLEDEIIATYMKKLIKEN